MAIGPVQLVVLGFEKPDFRGEIIEELDRLRESDTVRLIDAVAVYKDANGEVLAIEHSDLSTEEAADFGAAVGALIGLGADGEEGMVAGAEAGAAAMADGVHVLSEEQAWDVLEDIPNDSAAAAPPPQAAPDPAPAPAAPVAPAAPAAPAEPAYMAELEQLNQLKTQGIISEEEYEAKKKQILGL